MSRWIEYDDAIERLGAYLMADAQIEWGGTASENIEDWKELATDILKGSPSIDLDDYVPRDFHDKTCEAMAKRHQEEIADLVSVVRCKECKYEPICNHSVQHTTYDAHYITIGSETVEWCSYGEREGE